MAKSKKTKKAKTIKKSDAQLKREYEKAARAYNEVLRDKTFELLHSIEIRSQESTCDGDTYFPLIKGFDVDIWCDRVVILIQGNKDECKHGED